MLDLEAWALRRFAPGPGNSIRPTDLSHLRKYGHPFDFGNFWQAALAAKVRVFEFEAQLSCERLHSDLLSLFAAAQIRHQAWEGWCHASHVLVLIRARDEARAKGITRSTLKCQADSRQGMHRGRKLTCADAATFKNGFQKFVLAELIRLEAYDHEAVLRKKLASLRIDAIPEGVLVISARVGLPL